MPSTIKNGFAATGVYSFNSNVIPYEALGPNLSIESNQNAMDILSSMAPGLIAAPGPNAVPGSNDAVRSNASPWSNAAVRSNAAPESNAAAVVQPLNYYVQYPEASTASVVTGFC